MSSLDGRLLAIGMLFTGICCLLAAGSSVGNEFDAEETISTLEVHIRVGEGDDLTEPVALDLGLGFPLWLYPLGLEEGETAPFGAALQTETETRTVRAGSSTSFTFEVDGASEDILQATSQLLANVRISDIARIGFISRGDTNWVLDGYEIRINDKSFAERSEVGMSVGSALETTREQIDEINLEIIPLETEGDDIAAFVQAGLATEEDEARLDEIREQITPLREDRNRLERVINGSYPWFVETDFQAPGRIGEPLRDVQVTLVTSSHTGAATANYVYYLTGGHKFLLSSPNNPLEPEAGPQVFRLDLLAGPLTASDLRGHALGMIGHENPHDDVPDRWHPQRLTVEVDGRVVYDSEENDLDRLSLEAIRVVPPAHFNSAGEVVENLPNARETFVWEAGKAMGLDLVHGGAAELPSPDEESWPEPEAGLVVGEEDWHEGFDEGFEPFPGEEFLDDDWDVDWNADVDWHASDDEGDTWDEEDWDWEPAPSWLDVLLGLFEYFGLLPDGLIPDPVGEPFQVVNVRYEADVVSWEVTGDTSDLDHFVIELLAVRPHQETDVFESVTTIVVEDVGQRELAVAPPDIPADFDEATRLFVAPMVTAIDNAGEMSEAEIGAARPLVPSRITPRPTWYYVVSREVGDDVVLERRDAGGVANEPPAEGTTDRAAWRGGQLLSHSGLLFDASISPDYVNVTTRPEEGDVTIGIDWNLPGGAGWFSGRYRVVALLGFAGSEAGDVTNSADVEVSCELIAHDPDADADDDDRIDCGSRLVQLRSSPDRVPRMELVEFDLDPSEGDDGAYTGHLDIAITGGDLSVDHPPAVFGLRFISR